MKKLIIIISIVLFLLLGLFGNASGENLIVIKAKAEIGSGETEKNNAGPDIRRYTRGRNVAWCAGFVSYILQESNVYLFKYSLSAKAIYNEAKIKGRITDNPQAGDLVVFNRGNPKSWQAHIGIIEKVSSTHIYTIEGNVGRYPATVERFTYNKDNIKNLLGYIKTGKSF